MRAGDPDVEALAAELGVRYFTRKGRPAWNQPGPPFQAKTKAGNVNAWLDHVGMQGLDYDVFVQMDIDHHPIPEYLDRTLGYFDDPAVAWVQAPSVSGNLDSWTSRGLAEQDLVLQGPLQMGFYGHSRTPFIIGSHTTYRTEAVRGIGGFQPTRAEDHLDTVALAAAGHTGVFVPEIIATGEGPADFGTYLGQQFAWAYSMVQILLRHTPRLVRRYTPGQAFQFLMAQSWYTLWSLSLGVLWVLPMVALLSGRPIADVSLLEYLVYNLAVVLTATLMWRWSRRWFQPQGIGLSWRGMLLEIARWPIVLWAVVNAVLRVKRPYMITPKGVRAGGPPPGARLYGPSLVLAELALGAIGVFYAAGGHAPTQGYVVLVLLNLAMVITLLVTALALELRDLRRRTGPAGHPRAFPGGVDTGGRGGHRRHRGSDGRLLGTARGVDRMTARRRSGALLSGAPAVRGGRAAGPAARRSLGWRDTGRRAAPVARPGRSDRAAGTARRHDAGPGSQRRPALENG